MRIKTAKYGNLCEQFLLKTFQQAFQHQKYQNVRFYLGFYFFMAISSQRYESFLARKDLKMAKLQTLCSETKKGQLRTKNDK